jgi:hypothetical protein
MMNLNAYILDWTMDEYEQLLTQLERLGFFFQKDHDSNHVRVNVPFSKVNDFADLVQAHLNAPFNYVDIQFPQEKKTVVIFQGKHFTIENDQQNEEVINWAINLGLPTEQAKWGKSYIQE